MDWAETGTALRKRVADAIQAGTTPGAAVTAGSSTGPAASLALGALTPGGQDATTDTLWDLSSVTKVVAGASLLGVALREGLVTLDAPVSSFTSAYRTGRWDDVTVDHLVTHTAGQPPWHPFFTEGLDRAGLRRRIAELGAVYSPGTRAEYSDLDFLVLWDVLERALAAPLVVALAEHVLAPLGLRSTTYRPAERGWAQRCAPTELCSWRGKVLQGEVHDENCAALGGVSPHAGLFSTVGDVGTFLTEVLRSVRGESDWLDHGTATVLTTRRGSIGSTFGVGWAMPIDGTGHRGDALLPPFRFAAAGRLLSDRSFGHTGFAGCSVVVDPDRDRWLAVMTNRIHPSRSASGSVELRADLADLLAGEGHK